MNSVVQKSSRVQKVLRNAALVTVSSLFSQVLLGITGIVIVRYLGLSLFSEYSTAMLYMGMFSVLGRLGFNRVFLRECSRDPSSTPEYFGAALVLNCSLALIGWFVALIIAYFKYDAKIFILTVILGSGLLMMTLRSMANIVFQAKQKMHFTALSTIIGSLFYGISFFIAVTMKASVFVLAGLHLAMNLITLLFSYGFSFRLAFPKLDLSTIKTMLYIGKHFCVISLMVVSYSQSSGFILAFLNLGEEVGIYNAAFRLYALAQMVAHVIDSAMSPALYNASMESDRIIRGVKLAIRYFTITGILVASIFIGRADWLMVTVFNAEFIRSALILKLLSFAVAFRFIVFLLQHVIYAKNKEKFMMITITCLAIFTIISGIIFIPRYGGFAAALIFVIGEGLMAIACFVKSEQLLGYPGFWKLFILPVFSGVVTITFLNITAGYPVSGLLFSPFVFFGILCLGRYYSFGEVSFLFRTLVPSK